MYITRTPLRISLGGGGTDLPSYYKNSGGLVLSAAINKYIYISINEPFTDNYILKYSKIENQKKIIDINHPIIREILLEYGENIPRIEITSAADIPAGTGLGSSSSFTVGLIKALHDFQNKKIIPFKLAEGACNIELNKLREPIGKQDQFIAAHGGIKVLKFNSNDSVEVSNLNINKENISQLEKRLHLYFTGITRSASEILKEQDDKSLDNDKEMIRNLDFVKNIGFETISCLEKGDITHMGKLMIEHWFYKKKRSKKMTNSNIDEIYDYAINNGALGGKLIGAGAGGFLMFLSDETKNLSESMREIGMKELNFKFDQDGAKNIISET